MFDSLAIYYVRILFVCFALVCLQCGKVGADIVEFKFHDYEAKVDESPRAQQDGWKHWGFVKESRFRELQHEYDADVFDAWMKKLKLIQPGMTVDEIKTDLQPKAVDHMVSLGVGVIAIIELDEVYFVHGLFSSEGKLLNMAPHPLAITYGVRRENRSSEDGAGTEKRLRE